MTKLVYSFADIFSNRIFTIPDYQRVNNRATYPKEYNVNCVRGDRSEGGIR